MDTRIYITTLRKLSMAAFVTAAAVLAPVASASEAFEREQLALLLKQIENAKKITAQAHQKITPSETDRFWFDYERLERDLQRIQHGVEHYMTPHRAQPRELYDEMANIDGARSYTRDRRELKSAQAVSGNKKP